MPSELAQYFSCILIYWFACTCQVVLQGGGTAFIQVGQIRKLIIV